MHKATVGTQQKNTENVLHAMVIKLNSQINETFWIRRDAKK